MSDGQPEPSKATLQDLTGAYTLDEIIEIEALAGCPIDEVLDGDWGRGLRAVAFVQGKRANPEFTLEDAGRMTAHIEFDSELA